MQVRPTQQYPGGPPQDWVLAAHMMCSLSWTELRSSEVHMLKPKVPTVTVLGGGPVRRSVTSNGVTEWGLTQENWGSYKKRKRHQQGAHRGDHVRTQWPSAS